MKWFKHLTGSLNNSIIFEAIEKFGSDGYLVFFGTLELMADEFDVHNPGEIILSMKKLRKNLQLSRQKTVKILAFFDKKAKEKLTKKQSFFATVEGDKVKLYSPRLKQLTDEYTRKELAKMSGVCQDIVRSLSGATETETETEVLKQLRGHCKNLNKIAKSDQVKFNSYAFFNTILLKGKCPPKLAVEVAQGLIKGWPTMRTNPYALGNAIYKTRLQNYNERNSIDDALNFKKTWTDWTETKQAKQLIKGIIK